MPKTKVRAPKGVGGPEARKLAEQSRIYPPEDPPLPRAGKAAQAHRRTKLRKSITPGTVLILLAGRFKGKRVVTLKQLDSGLLLVSGPFSVNGVPLRRVNQAYVIATSAKIDVSSVDASKFDDSYFAKKQPRDRRPPSERQLVEERTEKPSLPKEYIDDNRAIDSKLAQAVDQVDSMRGYLGSRFTLKAGDKPHLMRF
jgi:large subunit ribosomal protein L6e